MSVPSQPDPASQAFIRGSTFTRLESRQVQSLFREVNEQIRLISHDTGGVDDLELVCECANPGCFETLRVAPDRYEDVRQVPTRFIIRPGHVAAAAERVVDETPSFAVVEKIGPAAFAAIRLDPRRRPSSERRAAE